MARGGRLATGIPARLTAGEGRRFAFTLAVAFAVLATLLWWRGRPMLASVPLVLGAGLALAGLVMPTRLGPVERAWMGFAHALSKVTTPIFMSVVYYMVLTPTGLLRRAIAGSPLRNRHGDKTCWVDRQASPRGDLNRQF